MKTDAKNHAKAEKILDGWETRLETQAVRIVAACNEAVSVFKKHFPENDSHLEAPIALAACLEVFDIGDPKDAGQLYLEWTLEHYVGRKVKANIDVIKMTVASLKKADYTEDNPYYWNDGDNKLFYIPHDEFLIFCAESQNTNYVYLLIPGTVIVGEPEYFQVMGDKFHIRRYYDVYDPDEKDKWDLEEAEKYTKGGILAAIISSDWLSQRWSDCLPGNKYPCRPSLAYFKERGFKFQYSDCRDIGYVLSYGATLGAPRAERALSCFPDIRTAFFDMRCAAKQVKDNYADEC